MVQSFFHFSETEFDVGKELLPNGEFSISPEIEQILDTYKPATSISRRDAVFLSEDQNFSGYGLGNKIGHIYQVEISDGTATLRVDATWFAIIQQKEIERNYGTLPDQKHKEYAALSDEELAHRYWEGLQTSDPCWEVLVPKATVTKMVSSAPVLASATNAGSFIGTIYTALNED